MESCDEVSLEEYDTENLSDICQTLQKSSIQFAQEFESTYQQFKLLRKKVKDESAALDEMPLKPRAATRKWLAAKGLSNEVTFTLFFETLLNQLAADHRLDLTNRTIIPTKDIASLYQIPLDVPISIFDILERTPLLFH
jgi:hypothetical protein